MKKSSPARSARRNPGAETPKQWSNAVAQVCTKKRERKGECSKSNDAETLAAVRMIRETPPADRSAFAKQLAAGRRRNPETAAEMFEAFHGRPPAGERTITEEVRYPHSLADCGSLVELVAVFMDGEKAAVIAFRGKGVRVATTPNGKEIHFVGGDQELDLQTLRLQDQDGKPNVLVGYAHTIAYHTSKHFHNFEPSDYEHEFGEETGEKPLLAYDPRSRKLYLVGGAYEVRPEGIVN